LDDDLKDKAKRQRGKEAEANRQGGNSQKATRLNEFTYFGLRKEAF